MTISVLTDNHAGSFCQAEHGLSYLIEYDGMKLLFDTGQTDLFMRNAKIMNISLDDIDIIILSHGHFDHGNGLGYLKGGTLVCHPGCFSKRYRKTDRTYIGLEFTPDELSGKFNLITSAVPYKIREKIIFLGGIPRVRDFESQHTSFIFEKGSPDFVDDDSAVAISMPEGLFIVTGCGHSGIVNTIEHARKVTGENRIYGILGGFHLKEIDAQTTETINYLRINKVKHIIPSHCTELPAMSAFYEAFGIKQVSTGDVMNF